MCSGIATRLDSGFATSRREAPGPNSTKGSFFSRQFQQIGWDVVQPDLNEGDFEGLTLTRQLKLIDRIAREIEPRLVMGSSLGGYLAALYGALYPEQAPALVLMAPAFGFPGRWAERLGEEALLAWREKGSMPVYHYGEGGMRDIGYGLYQDALWFDDSPDVKQPTLIFHGKYDEQVNAELSVEFAVGKSNVQLELLESGHGLTDVMERMWERTASFSLGIETPAGPRA